MFSTVLQELKGYFGRGFLLAVFFPVLLFESASLALFFESTQGLKATLAAWEAFSLQTQALLLVGGLAIAVILAYFLRNLQYSITRLFEGYWSQIPVLRSLRNARVDLHRRRWDYLDALAQSAGTLTLANEIIAEQLAYYPPPNHLDKVMPTRVGNVMRAAEIYAYDRYGIDPAIIWSRLRPLLASEALAALEDKRITLSFMLLVSLLSAAFTLIWCPVLAFFTNRWGLFLLCALGWPLAWVSYQNAVQSARAYGEQVKATFDLYRHDLLKALDRPVPAGAGAERREWLRLSRFFYRNVPIPASPAAPEQPRGWDRVANALADYIERINSQEPGHGDGGDR
jgi:hypothetical protein